MMSQQNESELEVKLRNMQEEGTAGVDNDRGNGYVDHKDDSSEQGAVFLFYGCIPRAP